jgi:hypothetical protein
MAWIPGGEFSVGAQDPPDINEVGMQATVDARPIHTVILFGVMSQPQRKVDGERSPAAGLFFAPINIAHATW